MAFIKGHGVWLWKGWLRRLQGAALQPVSWRSQWVMQSSTTRSREGPCRHQDAPGCASGALAPSLLPPASLPPSFLCCLPSPPSLPVPFLIWQVFIEHLSYARHPGRCWDLMIKQNKVIPPALGVCSLMEKIRVGFVFLFVFL